MNGTAGIGHGLQAHDLAKACSAQISTMQGLYWALRTISVMQATMTDSQRQAIRRWTAHDEADRAIRRAILGG